MTARRLLVVVLGASEFPRMRQRNKDNVAFRNSATALANFLGGERHGPGAYVVESLFDADDSVGDHVYRLADLLRKHADATDLIIYYVGHGGFIGRKDYFLTLRSTDDVHSDVTGLRASTLARVVKESFHGAVYVLLDCCFAGHAVAEFQSVDAVGRLASTITLPALGERGTAMLIATSKEEPALAPTGRPFTMFAEGLLTALASGAANLGEYLSLQDVGDLVVDVLRRRYPPDYVVLPEVHSPRQIGPSVAKRPLFANAAYRADRPSPGADAPPHPLDRFRDGPAAGLAQLLREAERHYRILGRGAPEPVDWLDQVGAWREAVAAADPAQIVLMRFGPPTEEELSGAFRQLAEWLRGRTGVPVTYNLPTTAWEERGRAV
ncbi:hypothetical protein [Dactylosporangium sp. NPDC048998]|uniref:hypothetical protein n=1 Tax=Dactylosporangium sp. NPDC048998 TaxID=3363976 RepID=UPI0037134958